MSANDSEKIVPPKKSKAARKTEEKKEDAISNHESEEVDQAKEGNVEKNVFNEEPILEGKRKRNSPALENFAKEWLQKHLIEAEVTLILFTSDIYKCYVESCTSNGGMSLLEGEFTKVMNSIFPKGYTLAPDCPYKDAIRKRKIHKKQGAKVVQADSLQLKMKDMIMEAIVSLGNPRRGVSMNAMKNFVSGKYPALRLDQREGNFKKVVSNLLRFKKLDCVRGIGACGFYRLPRTPEEEEEEIAKEKIEIKEKMKKKKEKHAALKKKQEDKEDKPEGEGDKTTDIDDGASGKKSAKDDDNDTDEEEKGGGDAGRDAPKEEDKEKEGEVPAEELQADDKKVVEKKKKKKLKKPSGSGVKDFLNFENPTRVEDTFPLAMTYNCEPKEASTLKIAKYVTDFYQQDLSSKDKLKKCLEIGTEKGFWTQVTGASSGSGTYRLTIDEFDPNADSDLTGMIMNAIVACTEPKVSSASLLKKYIQEYHPGLKVVEQPRKFKLALLRAAGSNMIKQLSGIGATGSFQLMETFRPSPSILQGKDSSDLPSSGKRDDDDDDDDDNVEGGGLELYQDAYKPRPSKRRGMGRAVEMTKVLRLDLSTYPALKKGKQAIGSSNGTTPRRSATQAGRGGRTVSSPKKAVKRPSPHYDDDDDDEEEEEEDEVEEISEPEFEPKKSRSGKGAAGRGAKKTVAVDKKSQQTAATQKPSKASKTNKAVVASPKTKKGKPSRAAAGTSNPPAKLEARAAKRRISYAEPDNDEEEEEEDDKSEEDHKVGSTRKAISTPKKRPGRMSMSSGKKQSVEQVFVVLERGVENQSPKAQMNSGKGTRSTKGGASSAVTNGSKSSPSKAKKGSKGRKKLRSKH